MMAVIAVSGCGYCTAHADSKAGEDLDPNNAASERHCSSYSRWRNFSFAKNVNDSCKVVRLRHWELVTRSSIQLFVRRRGSVCKTVSCFFFHSLQFYLQFIKMHILIETPKVPQGTYLSYISRILSIQISGPLGKWVTNSKWSLSTV